MIKKEETKFINSDWMEGISSISSVIKGIEAEMNSRRILRVLYDKTKEKQKARELSYLRAKSKQLGFTLEAVSSEEIDLHTLGNTHGGIIAECSARSIPELSLDLILDRGVYFLLEGVEDPYNFGYAVRSLYAAGVDGVILPPRNWMGAAGVVARSSAGASEQMPMLIAEPSHALDLFRQKGYRILCAGIRDSVSLFDADLSKPLLIVMGGEKRGISRTLLDEADEIVRIDYGRAFQGSLSTAAATAIFAFEILRNNR